MVEDYYRWIIPNYRDRQIKEGCLRFEVAEKQAKMQPLKVDEIAKYVNEFLAKLGIRIVEKPKIKFEKSFTDEFHRIIERLKNEKLSSMDDIIWMKFTTDDYLGVVATSLDINFSTTNTSGKIINHLDKKWNEEFVLVFPLPNIPKPLNRQLIESGIGNYLISKNVPILNFYSHNM